MVSGITWDRRLGSPRKCPHPIASERRLVNDHQPTNCYQSQNYSIGGLTQVKAAYGIEKFQN